MPYAKIVYIKMFLSLFEEDDRFLYKLNESQQLLYLKLLYLAGATKNEIPKNLSFIKNKINYAHDFDCLTADLKRITDVFDQFIEEPNFYKFNKFDELHNFIGGRNSFGTPLELRRFSQKENKKEKENTNCSLFEKFWESYPKKKSKGSAEKAFNKLPLDEAFFKLLMGGLEASKRSEQWTKDNGKFIPYPATWLNAKGWEDEHETHTFTKKESDPWQTAQAI